LINGKVWIMFMLKEKHIKFINKLE